MQEKVSRAHIKPAPLLERIMNLIDIERLQHGINFSSDPFKHAGPGLANQSRMGKSNQIRNRYGNTENNFRPVCYRQCSREAGLSERPEQV